MLIPLRRVELQKVIPAVATGNQFRSMLGDPRKILQRVMISSIGGSITLVISQSQVSSQFYSLWLILGFIFLLYILWGPIVEAGQKNSVLRTYNYSALFVGEIDNIYTQEKIEGSYEQANNRGNLEVVENRRTWLYLELSDSEGYLGEIAFPMGKNHQVLRQGVKILCIVFSNSNDFGKIINISDAWIPSNRLWVGNYPYLLRPAFEELCQRTIPR